MTAKAKETRDPYVSDDMVECIVLVSGVTWGLEVLKAGAKFSRPRHTLTSARTQRRRHGVVKYMTVEAWEKKQKRVAEEEGAGAEDVLFKEPAGKG